MAIREHHVLLTSLTMLAAGGQLPSCSSIEDVEHIHKVSEKESNVRKHFKSRF
jgi:hypothetical protein